VVDITGEVEEAVRESGVGEGLACVYSQSPGCVIRVNELESGLMEDFAALLDRLGAASPTAPAPRPGHLAMLLGPAGESLPVRGGALALGQWQRVLTLVLDDVEPRWTISVVGA
jgi:thiamine phosphate synthase YjbQ (UPF0047 family)